MWKRSQGKRRERRFLFINWPEGSTRRVLLLLVTAGCMFLAAWARLLPPKLAYVEGDTVERTIRAPRSGAYVDPEETEKAREEAAASVSDVYQRDPNALQDALTALDDIFDHFHRVRSDPELTDTTERVRALRNFDIRLSAETLELAASPSTSDSSLQRLHESVSGLVRRQMNREIRSNTDDLRKAREDLAQDARGLGLTSAFTAMAVEIGQAVLKHNLIYDHEQTESARQEKREIVKPVTHQVRAGEIIIFRGEEVRPRHIAMFQAVGLMQAMLDYTQALGMLVLFVLMVLLLGLYIMRFAPDSYADFGQLVTVAGLLVAVAFIYRTIEPTSWFEGGALTVAVTASMIVALLLNVQVAAATGVFLAMLLPVIAPGNDARLALMTIVCTVAGSFAVSRRGSMSGVIAWAAVLMALLNAAVMVASWEVFGMAVNVRMMIIAAIGGLASPMLAMGASVVLERLVGVTTDFRLMELGNPNEPILQRLIRDAPGSYQSSVMVGNLAEPAAEAIGANALLVRIAAMYHDIGKIRRPYFFVENQFGGDNPHDRLSPHLSALVIASHVKEGLELADEYGLPPVIKSFIPEHHGTSLARYFYDRARELADDPDQVNDGDFRYPGPKPQSRETALFMLADTVEAAARTLEQPTAQDIRELVDRLVDEKVRDGQLDESPLSFEDLATIKRSFASTLSSMFHHRVKYPDQLAREAARAQEEAEGPAETAAAAVAASEAAARRETAAEAEDAPAHPRMTEDDL